MSAAIEFAQIEPVGQCNLRCQMCPVQFRPSGPPHGPLAFMPFAEFQRLLDQLPALKTLHLQGLGEPLMHPEFFRMVEYATARGIQVSTNTNLTLLSARRARQCVASGLYELHASLDAATPEVYERIRVRAQYTRVQRHLAALMQARRELASEHPRVRLVVVLMRQNLKELPALVRLASAHGVSSMFVQYLCHDYDDATLPARYRPMRDFIAHQGLDNDDGDAVNRCFAEARAEAERLGVTLRLPRTQPRLTEARGAARCDWPWRGPYISYSGEVMPCCMVGTPDRAQLGSVTQHSIEAVWTGADYRSFRTALESDVPPEVCRSCSVYRGVF
mgnify:CR=1 FL=1